MNKPLYESWKKLSRAHKKRVTTIKVASRHPFAVPFMTFAVLMTLTAIGYAVAVTTHHLVAPPDAKIVIISYDHIQQTVPSRDATVGGLLKKLNIQLHEGDVVEPTLLSRIDQDQFRVNIYRAVPVQIVDGTTKTYTFSAATTPRAIVTQANMAVYPEDAVSVDPVQNFVKSGVVGQVVDISRSLPVNLNLYGTALALRTHADTVGDLLQQKNIKLAKDDQVTPSQDTPLTPNTQVFVTRVGVKIESVTEVIAMPVETIQDPGLAYGTSAVRQKGSAGSKVTTYQDNLRNNIVVSRSLLQTVVTVPAITQINVTGTSLSGIKGDMALAGIAPGDYNYADYIISHESGWCPTKAQGQYGGCPAYSGSVPSTGGYGLCQSTPGIKMASAGADWQTNPVTQLRWCSGYAQGRYGSWGAAYTHWINYHNW
ncbi:MAG: ubiquitin-like domain-containing protein [Candidatus Saccharibacteria bacterium]